MKAKCPKNLLSFCLAAGVLIFSSIHAKSVNLQGQLSGWSLVNIDQDGQTQIGLRYLPTVSGLVPLSSSISLDTEVSFNMYTSTIFRSRQTTRNENNFKNYRLWFRFFTDQFGVRLGLQKINFGAATLFRPLMWFDRMDPQDPLQLTDGVYGILLRYYFLNNANLWFWGLYGNDETKGWEFIPTRKNSIEWGGRVQHPVPRGEIAFTYHWRQTDVERGIPQLIHLAGLPENYAELASTLLDLKPATEQRFGLDGKWDITIGLWGEVVFIHRDIDWLPYKYQRMITVGTDYTFGLGNGVHCLYEHFWFEISEKIFGAGEGMEFSAFTVGYPLGLLDQLSGMIYYDWENKEWYRFVQWQRMYDNLSFYLIGFWNPDQFQIYQNLTEASVFAGKGFQIMLVFNH